jgi:hippurate hydrolase
MTVINSIADRADEHRGWRHELHMNPEIGYEEEWTSDFIAARLAEFGIEVHRGMGKTGVVGVLRGRGDGTRAIGLRADIDALADAGTERFRPCLAEPRADACLRT